MRITFVVVAVLALTSIAEAGKQKLAVLTLEGDTVNVSTALRARAMVGNARFVLAPNGANDQAALKRSHQCANEHPACMAAIGADLGADVLVFGHVESSARGVTVSLKAFDVAKKQVLVTYVDTIANGAGATVNEFAKRAFAKLLH